MDGNLETNNYERIHGRIAGMSDVHLSSVWKMLKDYDATEEYEPGISMDVWADAVSTEMDTRGLKKD